MVLVLEIQVLGSVSYILEIFINYKVNYEFLDISIAILCDNVPYLFRFSLIFSSF
jgi:hypothetical protein